MKGVLVKLTAAELELLDLAIGRGAADSRAAFLRAGMYVLMGRVGYGYTAMQAQQDRQERVRRRRSRAALERDVRECLEDQG